MARVSVQVPVPVEKPTTPEQQPSSSWLTKKNIRTAVIVTGVIAIIFFVITLLNDRNSLKKQVSQLNNGQTSGTQDAQKYSAEVAKLVEVPVGITPTVKIPTNEELTKLMTQNTLYKNAKPNDVFLVYNNTDKSIFLIIYRPANQKVILAVLDTSQQSNQTSNTKP